MGLKPIVFAFLLATSLFANPTLLHVNEPPHVDAGLDQTVNVGETVLLDAGGSRDPDGTIIGFEWRIETPNGSTVDPACSSCERTRFNASVVGTYTVRLTATDDDDASANDTLYVTVTPDDGPTLTLAGPSQGNTGDRLTFTAEVEPGSEPVTNLSWTVDGKRIRGMNATQLERAFQNTGGHSMSVTVTDAIGRTSTATHDVAISNNSGAGPGNPIVTPGPGDPGGGNQTPITPPNGSATLAETYDPYITGPQLVLGDQPLEASYYLSDRPSSSNISSVEWVVNDGARQRAVDVGITWTPGDHTLHAIVEYDDGSQDTARFANGTREVIADSAPQPTLSDIDLQNQELTGSFDVIDEYGNIESIKVTVDSAPIFEGNYPPQVYQNRHHITNDYTTRVDNQSTDHTLTLTATDTRGQTRSTTRSVTQNEGPEVIEAGFLNSPVDTYHPRIISERYTANHIVRVDLNGYPKSEIEVNHIYVGKEIINLQPKKYSYDPSGDILSIRTSWAGSDLGNFHITPVISTKKHGQLYKNESTFKVTPSPPELRLTSPADGTKMRVNDWGMIVDARRSFDPDGTELGLEWTGGARPLASNHFIGKLDPFKQAGVRISDELGFSVEHPGSFLPFYIPRIDDVETATDGPYNESESVLLEVRTDPYAFTKNPNVYNISLGARSNSSAVVVESIRKEKLNHSQVGQYSAVQHRLYRWVATVRISAGSLNESQNWVTLYNKEKPEQVYVSEELGDVNLRFESEKKDLTIEYLAYEVRNESGVESRRVRDRKLVRVLTKNGWELDDSTEVVDAVSIERQVQETYYETQTHHFDSERQARKMAGSQPEWRYEGSETYTKTERGTESRWVKDPTKGRPTKETRRVLLNPGAMRTEREYQYTVSMQVETWKSFTKEITRTVTRYNKTRTQICPPLGECYYRIDKEPYTVTETVEKSFRRKVTETREIDRYYWAKNPKQRSHTPTGSTRTIRTEPREYGLEYLVLVPYERNTEITQHVVSKQVSKTRRTWEQYTDVASMEDARVYVANPDKRISDVSKHTEWTLVRNSTVTEVVRQYDNQSNVNTTFATVSGTLVYGPNPEDTRPFTLHIELSGYATNEKIVEHVMNVSLSCNDAEKVNCYA